MALVVGRYEGLFTLKSHISRGQSTHTTTTFNLLSFFLRIHMTKNVPSCKILHIFSETRSFRYSNVTLTSFILSLEKGDTKVCLP
jgi:hypothetical protein